MAPNKADLAYVEGVVNSQTYRFPWAADDAIVHINVTPCPGSPGTPAWFIDALGAVQLDLNAIYNGDEKKIDAAIKAVIASRHHGIPKVWLGLLAHEFAHSRWSRWLPDTSYSRAVIQVVTLFEEIRIETRAADWKGGDGVNFLRHSFKWLLMQLIEGGDLSTKPKALAHTWALTFGRYIAGIAKKDEIQAIDDAIRTALTDDTVDILREILEEAVNVPSIDRVYELAEEWLELLTSDDDDEDGESDGETLVLHGNPGDGEEDEEESEKSAKPTPGGVPSDEDNTEGDPAKGIADSVSDADDESGSGDEDDADEESGGTFTDSDSYSEELKEVLAAALAEVANELQPELPPGDVQLTRDVMATSSKVFGKGATNSGKRNWNERTPSGTLRAEAAKLARLLEAVSLPTITLTHRPSAIPPGRLRSREAVRQSAERSMGMMSTATPFRSTKRDRTTNKPVVVGTMTDTSGSMNYAQKLVADFAWMMSTAGQRVGARSAAVTFGNVAEAVTRPGEIPQVVRERLANGGREAFDEAAAAIEGVLRVGVNTNAAKIVFIISDGEFVISGERQRAALWLEKWTQAGALVVWINCDPGNWRVISSKVKKPGQAINMMVRDPRKLVVEMEKEVLRAARGLSL